MTEIMTIPVSAYRAFKVLPMQKGKADPSRIYSEFVRLGVTAYDFTMTYADGFALIRCAWPKPKDMGNVLEGYFAYLTKAEFQRLEYDAKKGAYLFPLDERECPFQRDLLNDTAVQTLVDPTGSHTFGKIEITRHFNPKILQTVTKALATICSKGLKDGGDAICSFDIGSSPDIPLKMSSYVHRDRMSIYALVMPVRM